MAEEVVINRWCDSHLAQDETAQFKGEQHTLTIDGEGPALLDFCPGCHAEKLEPLLKLIASHGRPVQKSTKRRPRRTAAAASAPPAPQVRSERATPTTVAPTPPAPDEEPSTTRMPLRSIPQEGVAMYCPFEDCSLNRDGKPSKNKRSLATHFTQRHGIPIAEWFRQHPDVDPQSLVVQGKPVKRGSKKAATTGS